MPGVTSSGCRIACGQQYLNAGRKELLENDGRGFQQPVRRSRNDGSKF